MNLEDFAHKMERYIPKPSIPIVFHWLGKYPCRLKITKPRTSKLGDFRAVRGQQPVITVNGNLEPEAFLITLAHEIAHLIDFQTRNSMRDPHGTAWKSIYAELLDELLRNDVFPRTLMPAVKRHIASPKAASCSDPSLTLALRHHEGKNTLLLKDLPENEIFTLKQGRVFIKGELRRTRFRCKELATGKQYLIHMLSEIEPSKAA